MTDRKQHDETHYAQGGASESKLSSAEERAHLEQLLNIHRRNLQELEKQAAGFGPLYVPLHLSNQIEVEQQEIQRIEQRLAELPETLASPTPPPGPPKPVSLPSPRPPPKAPAGTPSLPSSKLLYTNLALLFVALLATLFFINRCFSSTVLTIVVAALGVFGNLVAATKFQEPLRTQRAFWVCLVVTILSWMLAWLLPCPSDLRGKLYSTLTPTSTYTAPSCPIRIDEANKYPNGEASLDAVRGADPIRHDAIKITFVNPLPGSFSAWAVPLRICDATTSESLSFWVRGENGGERFEVGLKDSTTPSGQEPKIQQTASGDWQYVSIPLQGFQDLKKQDLSSLENFSLGFKYDLGNGTIYIDELTFGPP